MTPQTAAAVAAGTVAVGGSGVGAAYFAGAFPSSMENKTEQVETYKSQAEKQFTDKEYIGGSKEGVKKFLVESTKDTTYQGKLEEVWEKMNETGLGTTASPVTRPDKGDVKTAGKEDGVADYASKWCEYTSKLPLRTVPSGTEANKDTWDAFKDACFNTKTSN
ncbi:hypothetical protein MHSWG343_09030 [Candidatus Mycoplasma haematohominis]|uniref:Uncharacterized protein n=1 Tax=Candidatus Mycoplasma haematohominis TaxID=1494318 RepID=A0A478FU90_9MOLU|nr:hypothetical protein MHSWG343_09030 [Candidatus Mycoplasma haemohominis]